MSYFMKLAQTEEMRSVIKLTELNIRLSELLHSHLECMIRESKKLGLVFPDIERTVELMKKEKALVDSICQLGFSPEAKRPLDSPDNETEPIPV